MTSRIGAAVLLSALLCAAGCGGSAITEDRVERALAATFANLVPEQLARMGLARVSASSLRVAASCYRRAGGRAGAGEWACTVVWAGPNGATLRDNFEVSVGSNGCYTAALGATESQLGGPTVTGRDGQPIRNLLYGFDGCFDFF
jgi:ABC-2 type transport system permease protein